MLWLMLVQFGLAFMPAVNAQTYTNLYSFTVADSTPFTNRDGANPKAGLVSSGNTLYGTAYDGGSSGNGTIFSVNVEGTGFTNLYSFSGPYNNHAWVTNDDGANPQAGLVLFSNTLFGTASSGGLAGNGTVFAIGTDGAGFTNLHSFSACSASAPGSNSDGSTPEAGLVLVGNTLFGTTTDGGSSGMGTLFAVNTDGTGFTNLHSFSAASGGLAYTNSEGANPQAGLIFSGKTLYGTATRGGIFGEGTIFAISTKGTSFTNLHNFSAIKQNSNLGYTNGDGAMPQAGLVIAGRTLYGTAESGRWGAGVVFAINTDGTGFTNLYNFTVPGSTGTNSDGGFPEAGLILSGNTLYGTTDSGGAFGGGTVFAIHTDGTGFANLGSLGLSGGDESNAGLILLGDALYGTASEGGAGSAGTIFKINLCAPPPLSIAVSDTNIILAWPTNASTFTLQAAVDAGSTAAWTNNASAPVVINGQNTVTNAISAMQQFYRLAEF